MSFPRYPKYKDSGVEWLGEVPEHWGVERLKPILYEVDERIGERDALLLGLSKTAGVLPRAEIGQNASESDDYSKYKECRVGDLVMNKMQAWNGVFGLSAHTGIVSPDYAVFRFRDQRFAVFLTHAFRTELAAGEFFCRCRGMGTAFLRLNTGDFLDTKIALPPASEVPRITAFLCRETAKIDDLIAEQQRLTELLKEKRQAVISHAVTKGLNADARMKDSGIEWLGEVPEHWEVLPCRAIVRERTTKNEGAACTDYLSLMANVGIIPYEEKGDVGNKKPDDLSKCRLVYKGDFVINSMNYGIGSYGISGYDGVCSPVYIVLTPIQEVVEPRFAFRIFEDRAFQTYAQSFGNGILAHRCAINWDILKPICTPVPPRKEQQEILAHLDRRTAQYDALIAEQQRAITLLRERRSALISAAVTGEIDVRGLAESEAA